MSENEDDIEIIEDDPEVVVAEEPKKEDKLSPLITKEALAGADDLAKQIEDLRKAKVAEETARRAAEARAAAREQEAQGYQQQARSSQETMVEQALTNARAEADRLEEQARLAMEEGDFKKGLALQRKLAQAEALIVRAEEARASLRAVAPPAPAQRDPFEAAISGHSDRTRQWLRAHPECVQDVNKAHQAAAAHHQAVLSGFQPDTDAYFTYVEEQLGYREPVEAATPQKRAPVAPASRAPAAPTKRPDSNKRYVPAKIVQMAKDQGLPLKEWLAGHDAAVKSGAMEPLF